jgi:DNA-binding NarL/FixJ family response regulator
LQVLQALGGSKNKVRTILLSGVAEGEDISQAFDLGAQGFVMKDASSSTLYKSIREVMAGRYWLGGRSVASLSQSPKDFRGHAKKAKLQDYGLTSRELEIVKAMASGYRNRQIADQFSISEQTVKHHITNIFDKLGVYNRLELIIFATHHGIVE